MFRKSLQDVSLNMEVVYLFRSPINNRTHSLLIKNNVIIILTIPGQ